MLAKDSLVWGVDSDYLSPGELSVFVMGNISVEEICFPALTRMSIADPITHKFTYGYLISI